MSMSWIMIWLYEKLFSLTAWPRPQTLTITYPTPPPAPVPVIPPGALTNNEPIASWRRWVADSAERFSLLVPYWVGQSAISADSSSKERPQQGEMSGQHRHKPNKEERIHFYDKDAPHYGFTNFSPHPVKYLGKVYPTSEHLFQSFKVPVIDRKRHV